MVVGSAKEVSCVAEGRIEQSERWLLSQGVMSLDVSRVFTKGEFRKRPTCVTEEREAPPGGLAEFPRPRWPNSMTFVNRVRLRHLIGCHHPFVATWDDHSLTCFFSNCKAALVAR